MLKKTVAARNQSCSNFTVSITATFISAGVAKFEQFRSLYLYGRLHYCTDASRSQIEDLLVALLFGFGDVFVDFLPSRFEFFLLRMPVL